MPFTNLGAQHCLNGDSLCGETRYLALFDGNPTSGGTEVSGTGYARLARTSAQMPVTNNAVSISAGEWDDSADVSWGTPDYVALMQALTGTTVMAYAAISPAITEIVQGSRVFMNAADITATIPLS